MLEGSQRDEPPVSPPPEGTAAKLPEPAVDAKPPPEMPETTEPSPAEEAGRVALKQRLAEMQQAELLNQQAQQPPQRAEEPQQPQQPQQPAMPAHIEKWLAANPRYADPTDQIAQTELYLATLKCTRDGKSWEEPDFTDHIERHLGLRQQSNGNVPKQNNAAPAPRRVEQPVRQQLRAAAPVSAPPSREAASFSTGRPQSFRAPLTKEQI